MENRSQTLTEKFLEVADSTPDRWTLAWWKEQFDEVKRGYAGANHRMNLCHAAYEDIQASSRAATEQCREMAKRCDAADIEIGRLREEIVRLGEALQKAREAYAALRKNNGT